MRLLPLVISLFLPALAGAAPGPWTLSADHWARPRSGVVVATMAPLRQAVDALSARPGSRLLIRYPGGEDGQLWAWELRAWLVSLGVPSARQELQPGSRDAGRIELELIGEVKGK